MVFSLSGRLSTMRRMPGSGNSTTTATESGCVSISDDVMPHLGTRSSVKPVREQTDSGDIEVDERTIWRTSLIRAAVAYAVSRLAILIGGGIIAAELRADENKIHERLVWGSILRPDPHARVGALPKSATSMVLDVLTSWDGLWYMRIIRHGYPTFIPPHITYDQSQARVAFFPVYPYSVRVIDRVLPGGDTLAAIVLNLLLGAVFIVLVGLLTKAYFGSRYAEKAMVVTAIFPGSFVLLFTYSEATLLVLAAACLLLLHRERFLLAGLVAAAATATRPNGIALVAACVVAGVIVIRRERSVTSVARATAATAIAPLGFIAFQLWIDRHTGESRAWFRVQGEAWKEGTSFGLTAIRRTLEAFTQPLTSPTDLITAVSFITTIGLVWLAVRRHRLPLPAAAYSAVVIALMLLPATVTARPRFLFTAFPLLIVAAVWLEHPRRRDWWPWILSACLGGLVTLTALYGAYAAIP